MNVGTSGYLAGEMFTFSQNHLVVLFSFVHEFLKDPQPRP